ncbi:hypothetical protein [uncultured Butyricimonas sp.]|uniref:hypothetical protein n=1 Tax=uncultured Butyricimonas sp. TaxID=1268785 RepID=UPI0026DAA9E5|nr:hypothetical protein [uncultured Butyricimonas sp.]
MKKKKYNMDRNFRKEMLSQKFYNEKPIRRYNHLLGTLDAELPWTRGTKDGCAIGIGCDVLVKVDNTLSLQV